MTSEGEGVLKVIPQNVSWRSGCLPVSSNSKNKRNVSCLNEKLFNMTSIAGSASQKSNFQQNRELSSNSQKRRNLRYDSADSSDSGVGGESLVWSPCSSLSYSPPPILSDIEEDDDLPPSSEVISTVDGGGSCAPPPSPPQSSPSSPTEEDATTPPPCGVRRLVEGHAPLKDRPPDRPQHSFLSTSPTSRNRRKSSSSSSSSSSSRKRGSAATSISSATDSQEDSLQGSDVTKRCDGGLVTDEPALLARLSGSELPERGTRSPSKGSHLRRGASSIHRRDSTTAQQQQKQQQQQHQQKQLLINGFNNNSSSSSNKGISNNCSSKGVSEARRDIGEVCLPPSLSSLVEGSSSSSSSSSSLSGDSTPPPSSGTSTPTPSSSASATPSPPKVRFPAPPEKKDSTADVCRWRGCGAVLDQSSSLLEHIQAVHVEGQLEAESFRCLWIGCKVFDRASCSVSWLERHVLTHGGQKPFKCIVEGCGHRFRSQTALGRHVNHHFSSPTAAPAPRPQSQSSPVKLLRKNGRKLRYRKRPWSDIHRRPLVPRLFDFFDLSTMEKVRWGLICSLQQSATAAGLDSPRNYVTFQSRVICKRRNLQGDSEVLVRWSPGEILPDEWVKMDDVEETRSVPFHKLDHEGQIVASRLFCPNLGGGGRPAPHNKRKRSPHKRTNSFSDIEKI